MTNSDGPKNLFNRVNEQFGNDQSGHYFPIEGLPFPGTISAAVDPTGKRMGELNKQIMDERSVAPETAAVVVVFSTTEVEMSETELASPATLMEINDAGVNESRR